MAYLSQPHVLYALVTLIPPRLACLRFSSPRRLQSERGAADRKQLRQSRLCERVGQEANRRPHRQPSLRRRHF